MQPFLPTPDVAWRKTVELSRPVTLHHCLCPHLALLEHLETVDDTCEATRERLYAISIENLAVEQVVKEALITAGKLQHPLAIRFHQLLAKLCLSVLEGVTQGGVDARVLGEYVYPWVRSSNPHSETHSVWIILTSFLSSDASGSGLSNTVTLPPLLPSDRTQRLCVPPSEMQSRAALKLGCSLLIFSGTPSSR